MSEPTDEIGRSTAQWTARIVAVAAALGILALAGMTLARLWIPLVFAAWTASLLEPIAARATRLFRGRRALGAGVAVAVVLSLFVPVGLVLVSLYHSASALVRQLLASPAARQALTSVVSPERAATGQGAQRAALSARGLFNLALSHGDTAWRATQSFAGASAAAVLGVFLFFVALYTFLLDGARMWSWTRTHLPLAPTTMERLARAFHEVGRGLIVGAGLTALVQALLAGAIYAALDVPRFAVLASLTFVCAFIPAVGTAIVWAPLAVGFALTGHTGKAALMAAAGAFGISTIDNLIRPLLQRWGGKLDLPAFVLLLAAFGGLGAFGPAGLILGPLSLRMAREVLEIARDARG